MAKAVRLRVQPRVGGNSEFGFGFGWATPQVGVRVQVRVQVWPSGCGLGGSNAIIVYNTGVLEILWRTKKDMHRMLLVAACFQFWELVAAVETKPQKDNTHQLWTPRIKGYQLAPNLREQASKKRVLSMVLCHVQAKKKIDLAMIPVKKHHHFGPPGIQRCSSFHHSRWRNSKQRLESCPSLWCYLYPAEAELRLPSWDPSTIDSISVMQYHRRECSKIHVPVVPHKAVAEVSKIGNL